MMPIVKYHQTSIQRPAEKPENQKLQSEPDANRPSENLEDNQDIKENS